MKFSIVWKKIWRLFRSKRDAIVIEIDNIADEYKPLIKEAIEKLLLEFFSKKRF
jgi:hypothetical protein